MKRRDFAIGVEPRKLVGWIEAFAHYLVFFSSCSAEELLACGARKTQCNLRGFSVVATESGIHALFGC